MSSGASILRILPEEVEQIAMSIQQERDETVNALISRLRYLETNLDASWDGSAQLAFESRFSDWVIQLERYTETLSSVNKYLLSVVENYRQLDQAAAQAAQGSITP